MNKEKQFSGQNKLKIAQLLVKCVHKKIGRFTIRVLSCE